MPFILLTASGVDHRAIEMVRMISVEGSIRQHNVVLVLVFGTVKFDLRMWVAGI